MELQDLYATGVGQVVAIDLGKNSYPKVLGVMRPTALPIVLLEPGRFPAENDAEFTPRE